MKSKDNVKNLLLMAMLFWGFAIPVWSQDVSLDFKNAKVEKVLSAIKNQTKMGLVFSDQIVDVNRVVTIQMKDVALEDALKKILEGTNVTFEIKNNKIYLLEKAKNSSPGKK